MKSYDSSKVKVHCNQLIVCLFFLQEKVCHDLTINRERSCFIRMIGLANAKELSLGKEIESLVLRQFEKC